MRLVPVAQRRLPQEVGQIGCAHLPGATNVTISELWAPENLAARARNISAACCAGVRRAGLHPPQGPVRQWHREPSHRLTITSYQC